MDWTDLSIRVKTKDTELCEAIAQVVAPYGIQTEDYSTLEKDILEITNIDLIDERLLNSDRQHSIIHILLPPDSSINSIVDFITQRFSECDITADIYAKIVKEESWENTWKQYYHPIEVGKHLMIVPSWENCDCGSRIKVILDPGMAFGTGSHKTTQLCLELMEDYINNQTKVLDVGCGSGILGIAAVLLGAKKCDCVDIDRIATTVASENARRNNLTSPRINFLTGNIATDIVMEGQLESNYSLIVMNIVADVIISLAEACINHLAPGGKLVVSGIIDPRKFEVIFALKNLGLKQLTIKENGGWCAIVFEK